MIVEAKIEAWLRAALVDYSASPVLRSRIFTDLSHQGFPEALAPSLLMDSTKRWLTDEHVGAQLFYADTLFPIVANTRHTLALTGDPSLLEDSEKNGYQIIPAVTEKLAQLLQTQKIGVQTSYAQVPTDLPAYTVHCEQDTQEQAFLGESLRQTILSGAEADINTTEMGGTYVILSWGRSYIEATWLYALLVNMYVRAQQDFASWGLSEVKAVGSHRLPPPLEFVPELPHVKSFALTANRMEEAISTQDVEWINSLCIEVFAHYAQLHDTLPQPLP
jgi:hypothetical protein